MTTKARTGRQSNRRGRNNNPSVIEEAKRDVSGFFDTITGRKPKSKFDAATQLAEKFHGRSSKGFSEVREREKYYKNLAVLGELEELQVLCPDGKSIVPIKFKPSNMMGVSTEGQPYTVIVTASPDGNCIEFIGGDQSLEFDDKVVRTLEIEDMESKQYVNVGPVYSIAYFADKHHLTGPKQQRDGIAYEHEFGEEGGTMPELVYDTMNKRLVLVGGSYKIREEGIWN